MGWHAGAYSLVCTAGPSMRPLYHSFIHLPFGRGPFRTPYHKLVHEESAVYCAHGSSRFGTDSVLTSFEHVRRTCHLVSDRSIVHPALCRQSQSQSPTSPTAPTCTYFASVELATWDSARPCAQQVPQCARRTRAAALRAPHSHPLGSAGWAGAAVWEQGAAPFAPQAPRHGDDVAGTRRAEAN